MSANAEIRYSRARNGVMAFCCIAGIGGALFILSAQDVPVPLWAWALPVVVFLPPLVRMGTIALEAEGPAMIFDEDGIEFRRPSIGRIEWDRIDRVQLWGFLRRKSQIRIHFREPPPPFPPDAWRYYGLPQLLLRDEKQLDLVLAQFEDAGVPLAQAVGKFAPNVES